MLPPEVLETFKRAAAKQGSFEAFGEILYNDNKQLRDRLRDLEGKVPGAGSMVLAPEQAATYRQVAELLNTLDPADAGKALERLKALPDQGKRLAELERQQLLTRAATNPQTGQLEYKLSVLTDITRDVPIELEGEGDKQRVVVKANGKSQALREWLESSRADYLPALRASPGGMPAVGQGGARPGGATRTVASQAAAAFQAERDAVPNPLLKTPASQKKE